VAAGLVPFAHASDGGGSIRGPASVCGVFGFKPSRGRTVPASHASSDFLDMTCDHFMSRTVRDSALLLSITEDRLSQEPIGFVRDPISHPLRIGAWTQTMLGDEPEPVVRQAHDGVVSLLLDLGHHVESMVPPRYDVEALSKAFFVVAGAAVAEVVDAVDRVRGEPVQTNELEPFTWELVEAFEASGPGALQGARAAFRDAVRRYREATAGYDVILTPTLAVVPWSIGHLSPTLSLSTLIRRTGRLAGYAPIHNIAGDPAMSVPLTFIDDTIPVGAHFAAAAGADALLLGLAHQLERARPWKDRWPPYSIPKLFG